IAADDEPRPRACGMALSQVSSSPAGWSTPSRPNAASIDRTARCDSSAASSPAPSPRTVTRTLVPDTRAVTSSHRHSASPKASKPGPRLALVAGTRTRTGPLTKRGTPMILLGRPAGLAQRLPQGVLDLRVDAAQ